MQKRNVQHNGILRKFSPETSNDNLVWSILIVATKKWDSVLKFDAHKAILALITGQQPIWSVTTSR